MYTFTSSPKCLFRSYLGTDLSHILGETLISMWLMETVHCFCLVRLSSLLLYRPWSEHFGWLVDLVVYRLTFFSHFHCFRIQNVHPQKFYSIFLAYIFLHRVILQLKLESGWKSPVLTVKCCINVRDYYCYYIVLSSLIPPPVHPSILPSI